MLRKINMAEKLKELEYNVHVLADKLREQYAINSKLIKLIEGIGNFAYSEYANEKDGLNNSVDTLNDMNKKFELKNI